MNHPEGWFIFPCQVTLFNPDIAIEFSAKPIAISGLKRKCALSDPKQFFGFEGMVRPTISLHTRPSRRQESLAETAKSKLEKQAFGQSVQSCG